MKIWLDDKRPMPEGYDRHFTTGEELTKYLWDYVVFRDCEPITHIGFDHDLGEGITGYSVACTIEGFAEEGLIPPITWSIQSSNTPGVANITMAMKSAERFWGI